MKIFLSKRAEYKLDLLLVYLVENWSEKVKDDFINKLKSKFNQIAAFPNNCPKSAIKKNLYKCVLTKQTIFFYRINYKKEIEIITFFSTYQNPKKLEL